VFHSPVAIGDNVYIIRQHAHTSGSIENYITENIVKGVSFYRNSYVIDCGVIFGGCMSEEFEEKWFLSRVKAEAALVKLEQY